MTQTDLTQRICFGLKEAGINFVVSLPCSLFASLLSYIDSDKFFQHVRVTREEEGVGVAAGAYLGGLKPCMIIQNSGLGNSINGLASLNLTYQIPLLILASTRGGLGEKRVEHFVLGRTIQRIMECLNVPCFNVSSDINIEQTIINAQLYADTAQIPVVVFFAYQLLRK